MNRQSLLSAKLKGYPMAKSAKICCARRASYSLILRSDKPQAKKFKKWVTSEVLPSIRRTGGYAGAVPAFIRRFNHNWDRIDVGHFSVLSELVVRLWGRLEQVGCRIKDQSATGIELRPDVSVGLRFSKWLQKFHPTVSAKYKEYMHWTPQGDFPARQYSNDVWPLFIQYVDTVWSPDCGPQYFKTRDLRRWHIVQGCFRLPRKRLLKFEERPGLGAGFFRSAQRAAASTR
jgi:hypothetical protein